MATKKNPFDDLRINSGDVRRSQDWYRQQISRLPGLTGKVNRAIYNGDNTINIGQLYLFSYDPKHKDTLPVYDTLPLVLPFSTAPGGFLGINLHYLPYALRFKIMGALLSLVDETDPRSQAQVSWRILSSSSKFAGVGACVKHYLSSHVQSRFLNIPPDQWLNAAMMPVEQFHGAGKQQVFNQTLRNM
jgi:hypothetical protein